MSGSTPSPDDGPPRSRAGFWWVLVAVLAIVLVTLLVAQPWAPVETEPTPTATVTVSEPTQAPTTLSPSVPPPGSDAVFDATSAPGLFVTSGGAA